MIQRLNPGWSAQIYEKGDWLVSRLHVDILQQQTDLFHLEIYRQRLMCIAEEMGSYSSDRNQRKHSRTKRFLMRYLRP